MKIFGWFVVAVGLVIGKIFISLVNNVTLIGDPITGYVSFDRSMPFWILLLPVILIIVGVWLGVRNPKSKQFLCPKGCGLGQYGANFCGKCGERLVWR